VDRRTRDRRASKHPGIRELRGRCQISYTDAQGRRRQILTRFPYPGGISDAIRERNRRIREGQAEASAVPTFSQIAQIWLDTAELSPSTRRTSKGHLNSHWVPDLGHLPVSDVTYSLLRQVMAGNEKAALAPKTRKNLISTVRSVLALAVQSDYIKTNPAAQFGRIKSQAKEIDPFTREERDAILERLKGNMRLFYAIRFYTGMRPGEVLALTWADYDGATFTVDKQVVEGKSLANTKTHQRRQVMVPEYVKALLREHPTRFAKGRILVNRFGRPYKTYYRFSRAFQGACAALGIRQRSSYNARHTAATMMLRATRDPVWVAQQLGNSTEMIFRAYGGVIHEDRDEELRKKVEEYL
jgi:integrase